jgi:hypothetical protein
MKFVTRRKTMMRVREHAVGLGYLIPPSSVYALSSLHQQYGSNSAPVTLGQTLDEIRHKAQDGDAHS